MILQDLKVFLSKIFESLCQELIKNLAKSSRFLAGIYIKNLSKTLIKS